MVDSPLNLAFNKALPRLAEGRLPRTTRTTKARLTQLLVDLVQLFAEPTTNLFRPRRLLQLDFAKVLLLLLGTTLIDLEGVTRKANLSPSLVNMISTLLADFNPLAETPSRLAKLPPRSTRCSSRCST